MIETAQFETDLLYARRLPGDTGWTWTLASRLGHILRIAQELYGPRDPNYTILGVEFGGDIPQIWYPGDCGHVVVQISPACATDMNRACFQMAHEAIHLLSPSGEPRTTVLDEGLATHFSIRYMRKHLNSVWCIDEESYRSACSLTEQLLALDSNMIPTIRRRQPSLPRVTPDDIRTAHPSVPHDLAVAVTQTFQR